MHLTNYAINKHNKEFVNDDECGSKRKLSSVNKWLEENGYDIQKLWQSIEVSVQSLSHMHRLNFSCIYTRIFTSP